MFPKCALMNHSCLPNCHFIGAAEPETMSVRTLSPLRPGDELTVAYVDVLESRDIRREELLRGKYFSCECTRCSTPRDADVQLGMMCCGACKDETAWLIPVAEARKKKKERRKRPQEKTNKFRKRNISKQKIENRKSKISKKVHQCPTQFGCVPCQKSIQDMSVTPYI